MPHDLDSVVLRALAKDPAERYQSAEEMDADLGARRRGAAGRPGDRDGGDRSARRLGPDGRRADLGDLARTGDPAGAGAAGQHATRRLLRLRGPPRRRRPVWPWVLSVLLLLAAAGAAWFAYTKIQDQLSANQPVSVPFVKGLTESLAVQKINGANLNPQVGREFSDSVPKGTVIDQSPAAGDHVAKNTSVQLRSRRARRP